MEPEPTTAGGLSAAQLGRTVTVEVVAVFENEEVRSTEHGPLVRVQHAPEETLVSLGRWSGALHPSTPIHVQEAPRG